MTVDLDLLLPLRPTCQVKGLLADRVQAEAGGARDFGRVL